VGEVKRFVFIGCGAIAYHHAEVILELGHKIIGASARPNSESSWKFAKKYKLPIYSDTDLLLIELKPDAIILCVSWDQTEKILAEIVNFKIPILVEKPVALSTKKLRKILKSVGYINVGLHPSKGLTGNVLVGYNRRFYDFVPKIRRQLLTQELLSIQLNFPEITKGVEEYILFYMTSHWLDLLLYLVGDIEVVAMRFNKGYNGLLKVKKEGTPIHYQSNFNTPQQTSIGFSFTNSFWELRPIETLTICNKMKKIKPTKNKPISRYIPTKNKPIETDLTFKPGFYKQMQYFINKFLYHKKGEEIGCNLEGAKKVTALCETIIHSSFSKSL